MIGKIASGKLIPLAVLDSPASSEWLRHKTQGQEFWPEKEESERVENHELSSARQNRT